MEREPKHKLKTILEEPKMVKLAAEIVGLDIRGRTLNQIQEEVIIAGNKIISEYPKTPKNYRTIKDPPWISPLANSVVAIFWDGISKTSK